MIVTLELWHLITLLLAFFGCVGTFGSVLLRMFEKRLIERFSAQEKAQKAAAESQEKSRMEAQAHWDQRFTSLDSSSREWTRIEKDFLRWQAELPFRYVLRDDYVRNQTVIEAKMDAIATRLENLKLRGVVQ
jgi:hypothetical protein